MPINTKTAVDLFREYRLDYEAALEPCLLCLLDRCPPGELDALHALLDEHITSGVRPPYSPVQQRRQMEKLKPIMDRVFADPSVIAAEDQRKACWRDTPRWKKAWRRVTWKRWVWWGYATQVAFRRKPWE